MAARAAYGKVDVDSDFEQAQCVELKPSESGVLSKTHDTVQPWPPPHSLCSAHVYVGWRCDGSLYDWPKPPNHWANSSPIHFVQGRISLQPSMNTSSTYPKYRLDGTCNASTIVTSQGGKTFDRIYKYAAWNAHARENPEFMKPPFYYTYGQKLRDELERPSLSGHGSNLGAATERSLAFLRDVIKAKCIQTMLDVPCGDVSWQFHAWEVDSLAVYVGLDTASTVIKLNTIRFRRHMNKMFALWDFVRCSLPHIVLIDTSIHAGQKPEAFDLVHVRDVIQHLPLDQARTALCNIVMSGAKYLVTTTYPSGRNHNISVGHWYPNNLEASPFNFPRPDQCIRTHPSIDADSTCLWTLTNEVVANLSGSLCQSS